MRNDWSDFEQYLVGKIEKLSDKIDALSKDVNQLKGKAAAMGGIAGILGTALVEFFFKHKP